MIFGNRGEIEITAGEGGIIGCGYSCRFFETEMVKWKSCWWCVEREWLPRVEGIRFSGEWNESEIEIVPF